MDTSETYIKMCEQAFDIRLGRKLDYGDYYIERETYRSEPKVRIVEHKNGRLFLYSEVWLPRQDQLQEMVGEYEDAIDLFDSCFCGENEAGNKWEDFGRTRKFTSMEQLWLAFVMKEKFGKVWSGKEWAVA